MVLACTPAEPKHGIFTRLKAWLTVRILQCDGLLAPRTLLYPPGQTAILQSISRLHKLKRLDLEVHCSLDEPHTPASVLHTQDARSLGQLSGLTALTQLQLICPHYERCDARFSEAEGATSEQRRWQQLWPAQQEALAAALRHMPHLVNFKSNSLTLSASDLAALTSLTLVELAGLEPTAPTERQQPAAPGPGMAGRGPHQLLSLRLGGGACSPRALACLGAFPRLRAVIASPESRRVVTLPFGPADALPGGSHLLPDTPQVVRQAVRALADVRARGGVDDNAWHYKYGKEHVIRINADASPVLLLPPPVVTGLRLVLQTGHAPWLRELRPLAVPGQWVELWGLGLAPGDLACIADTFPDAKVRQRVAAWCRLSCHTVTLRTMLYCFDFQLSCWPVPDH